MFGAAFFVMPTDVRNSVSAVLSLATGPRCARAPLANAESARAPAAVAINLRRDSMTPRSFPTKRRQGRRSRIGEKARIGFVGAF